MQEPMTDVTVKLINEDGNAFYIIGAVTKALRRAGHHDLAEQFEQQAISGNYDQLLQTVMIFVHVE